MNISKFPFTFLLIIFLFSVITGCERAKKTAKRNQYIVQGMQLYRQHCANCHQVDGTGLARLIPPLKDSDYLKEMGPGVLACQIKYGLEGEIVVNGITFNQAMPGIPDLTPLEIAEIVTYVKNTWGGENELFDVKQTERALEECEL